MSSQRSIQTDVVVVGSGAVGVTASIEVKEAGGRVLILERESHLGGAAAISGGGCSLVGTPLQEQNGIEDSPDLAFDDWIKSGEGSADEQWVRFYVENSCHDLYQWAKDRGVNWVNINHQEGNTVGRWHRPEGGGGGLWHALYDVALARGIASWITSAAATELIVEDGRVVGVRAKNAETGESQEYYAKAVVLGTGGFASNLDMILEHRPDLRKHRILEGSHVGATGDGHRIAVEAGGTLTHMGDIWFYTFAIPDHRDPRSRRGLVIRGVPDAIWVNFQGKRFHNENKSGGGSGTRAVMAQEPAQCWAVIDGAMKEDVVVSDPYYYQEGISVRDYEKVAELLEISPHIKRGATLESLAQDMDVPVETFLDTINCYNGYIEDGLEQEPDFGRPLAGRQKIEQPPFYALNYGPLARKNFGGVKTNLRCQVLDKYYEPIPGLYAAGELTGMAGGHINGKAGLEGTMLGPALFSGRVAGAWAAREAGFGYGFGGKAPD